MSIEEAWTEATEYLVENDYPEIVSAIRTLALAVLEDTIPDPMPEARRDGILMGLMSIKKAVRRRILALGGTETPEEEN